MKITALSYRNALYGSLLLLVLVAFVALLVDVAHVGPLAPVLYIVLGVAWVIGSVRGVLSVRRVWVAVDPTAVDWRSWQSPKFPPYATPSGSVAVSEVARVVVAPLDRVLGKRTVRGHVPVLTLADGREVVLPAWSNAAVVSPQLKAVVAALRSSVPTTVTVDTTAIDGRSVAG